MENYISTWFTLSFLNASDGSPNKTHHLVSRAGRARLFQPWMEWQAANTTESGLQFAAKDQFSHFNDVSNEKLLLPYINCTVLFNIQIYEIQPNGSIENYTCPVGWHYQDTKNISHSVVCLDWEWVPLFNISLPCVREYRKNNASSQSQSFLLVVLATHLFI